MPKPPASRKRRARRGCLAAPAILLLVALAAFLLTFPGQQAQLALILATGLGIERLQARVDALEQEAIAGESFTAADIKFLSDLYTCFAKGARLTYVLRQSGALMDHYLSRSGEPLQLEPRLFLGSRSVQKVMDRQRDRLAQDLAASRPPAEEYASGTFHMGEPDLFDSSVGLYFGQIILRPRVEADGTLLLHWRAELPWQWPSYASLHEKYGDHHAQCFPLPNARSILQGPAYLLWLDDGLGEHLVQIGLARPFLAWSEWDEPAQRTTLGVDP